MEKVNNSVKHDEASYKHAHLFSEFAKTLQNIGSDLENSVSLFDAVGEKNDLFITLEQVFASPMNSLLKLNEDTKNGIFNFVLQNFKTSFFKKKDKINFIHFGKVNNSKIIFFISTDDVELKEALRKTEFEYDTSEIAKYVEVSFCYLNKEHEKEVMNTEKIELNHA